MSVRVLSKVLRESEATQGARLVLIAIADSASDDGIAWPSQETLSARARLSQRAVGRAVKELEEIAELEVRKAQRGRKRINVYRISLPELADPEYDRLPFSLVQPFSTTGHNDGSSDQRRQDKSGSDDRTLESGRQSTPLIISPGFGQPSLEPSGEDSASPRLPAQQPKSKPRNLPFDALSEECQADPRSRGSEIAAALKKIRDLEIESLDDATRLGFLQVEGSFDVHLADEVRRRAAVYRQKFSGATLTPTALAKWWLDIERVKVAKRGQTAQDVYDELS